MISLVCEKQNRRKRKLKDRDNRLEVPERRGVRRVVDMGEKGS